MANNYRGYFFGIDDCEHRYRVEFIVDDRQHTDWTEITLAGGSPCVVTYDSQNGPFDPVMYSHMAVEVISGDWLFDIYSQDAMSCPAYLYKEYEGSSDELVWCGYVTNNLLNMPQDNCINTFTVNCDDCLSVMDQYDYRLIAELDDLGDYKQIVTFADILRNVAMRGGMISNIVVDDTIKDESNVSVSPSSLKVSEKNFFSSDIEEKPWKFSEVLEEMCRWLGMTAIQKGNTLYIFDRQAHSTNTPVADADFQTIYNGYMSTNPFTTWTAGTYTVDNIAYKEIHVGGSGSDISMETVYNSVKVKDSFYEIEDFIPDLYDDDFLTNYDGNEWTALNIPCRQPTKPTYLDKKARMKEDADDALNDYFMKQWWHKWYTPSRYKAPYNEPATYHDIIINMTGTSYTGPFQAMTSFTTSYHIKNRSGASRTFTISQTEHYGAAYTGGTWYYDNVVSNTITLSPWAETNIDLTFTTFHQQTTDFSPRFKCGNGDYCALGQEIGVYGRPTACNVTSDIADLAVVAKAKDPGFYDRQIADTITWDRYLMIHQMDTPNAVVNPRNLTREQAWLTYPAVMSLNNGYHNPMILNDNAFLAINGSIKIERYKREYINPDWTGDATGVGGDYNASYWGIISGTKEIWTFPIALWFKLKIGNYYWSWNPNTRTGQWTTDYTLFPVDVSTNVDEDGYIDFSKLWNNDFSIINNISYTDYSGASGFKIPFDTSILDFNSQIEFSIHLPSRAQQYTGSGAHDGMNQYAYIKDLSIILFTKGSEKAELSDVVYENDTSSMNDASNNTLNDITCRITTYPGEGHHSYSNVGYGNVLADRFKKDGLGTALNKMEEHIVKCYVNEYGSNTLMETVVMDMSPSIISRIKDTDLGLFFHITGAQIDYANAKQTLSLVESKRYTL